MKILTKPQLLLMHKDLITAHGGLDGLRDETLLDSSLAAPMQTFGGAVLFPTIQQKAARLGFGLVQNHPFLDGNKRLGALSMLTLLVINGIELQHTQQELIDVILGVAAGRADFDALLAWVLAHEA